MAETQQVQDECNQVNQDLVKVLASEAVPIHSTDLDREDAMKFIPKTKETIGYIVMTVVFNDQGQVLLVQEAKEGCRGKWYLPAGRLEPHENIVDGAKREVMEEASLDCDITTLLSLYFSGSRWMRFAFCARVTGGKLKTLAEQDEESLQAAFYDIDTVFNNELVLRKKDILPVIKQALEYRESLASLPLHRELLPVITGHAVLLHRFVLVVDLGQESGLHMLVGKNRKPHILTSAISPEDPFLQSTVYAVLKKAFSEEGCSPRPAMHGILGIEHCGTGERMDGLCITTLVSLPVSSSKSLPLVQEEQFAWIHVSDDQCTDILRQGLDGRIVKLV